MFPTHNRLATFLVTAIAAAYWSSACVDGGDDDNVSHIRDGQEAAIGQFDFVAALVEDQDDGTNPFCTAVAIGDRWILSAAHCFLDHSGPTHRSSHAIVGRTDLTDPSDGIRVPIERIFLHPRFRDAGSGGLSIYDEFDLALLKVGSDIPASHRTSVGFELPAPFSATVRAVGYGQDENDQRVTHLRYAETFLKRGCVCTPRRTNKGDSGGPLLNDANEVIGIVSWSDRDLPILQDSFYAEPITYRDWIGDVMEHEAQSLIGFEQIVLRGEASPIESCDAGTGRCSAVARYLCQTADGLNHVNTSADSNDFDWEVFPLPPGTTRAEGITTFHLDGEVVELLLAGGTVWKRIRKPMQFDVGWSSLATADQIVDVLAARINTDTHYKRPRLSALTFTATLAADGLTTTALKTSFTFAVSEQDNRPNPKLRTMSLTRSVNPSAWEQDMLRPEKYDVLMPASLIGKTVEAQQRFDTPGGHFRQGLVVGYDQTLGIGRRDAMTRGGLIEDISSISFSSTTSVDADCSPGVPACAPFPPRSDLYRGVVAGQTLSKVRLVDANNRAVRTDCNL